MGPRLRGDDAVYSGGSIIVSPVQVKRTSKKKTPGSCLPGVF